MNGKGSTPRPLSVSREEFAKRWTETFRGANEQLDAGLISLAQRMAKKSKAKEYWVSHEGVFYNANPR
jgi:hypothetical protein